MRYRHGLATVAAAVCLTLLGGCTSVQVQPVAANFGIHDVCIVNNPKVLVSDFVPVLRERFSRHGINTSVVDEGHTGQCLVTLTYTALRSWDIKPYLAHAELRLWFEGKQIAFAQYTLHGGAGFDINFTKWRSTQKKMDPVIDQLLANQHGS